MYNSGGQWIAVATIAHVWRNQELIDAWEIHLVHRETAETVWIAPGICESQEEASEATIQLAMQANGYDARPETKPELLEELQQKRGRYVSIALGFEEPTPLPKSHEYRLTVGIIGCPPDWERRALPAGTIVSIAGIPFALMTDAAFAGRPENWDMYTKIRLEDLQREAEAKGCTFNPVLSSVCPRGTHCCNLTHEDATVPPSNPTRPQST
jgi:hypothetical protein